MLSLGLAAAGPVVTFHNGDDRAGAYVAPELSRAAVAHLHRDTGFDGAVPGRVYGQPLFWRGRVIVATETNDVLALDAATGKPVWSRNYGAAVRGGALPCGNVDPLGISGTPVLDAASGVLYFVTESGSPVRVLAYAVDAESGAVRPGWPVDLGAALAARGDRLDTATQGQRGALLLAGGRVFVPMGGRSGDCGAYRGRVLALDAVSGRLAAAWATRAEGGGIWANGGVSSDGQSVFAATGNTMRAAEWGDGEAVFRFDISLSPQAHYVAPNWRFLDDDDLDIGGTTPVPFALDGKRYVLALGKDAKAYWLDGVTLAPVLVEAIGRDQFRNASALWTEGHAAYAAVARRGPSCPLGKHGLTVWRMGVTPSPRIEVAWCAKLEGSFSPVVTTVDGVHDRLVWAVGADGDDRLHAFASDTGEEVYAGGGKAEHMHGLHYTSTPLVAAGRIYVAGDDRVFAFTP